MIFNSFTEINNIVGYENCVEVLNYNHWNWRSVIQVYEILVNTILNIEQMCY